MEKNQAGGNIQHSTFNIQHRNADGSDDQIYCRVGTKPPAEGSRPTSFKRASILQAGCPQPAVVVQRRVSRQIQFFACRLSACVYAPLWVRAEILAIYKDIVRAKSGTEAAALHTLRECVIVIGNRRPYASLGVGVATARPLPPPPFKAWFPKNGRAVCRQIYSCGYRRIRSWTRTRRSFL